MSEMNDTDGTKKPSKKELLHAFKADMKSADSLRQENIDSVEKWRKEYHGELYGNEEKGKSQIVSRDIKRQDEWQHASVKDPFVSDDDIIKCKPVTHEDRKASAQNELVLNHQFTRQFNRYKFMTDVIKLYYAEGTVVVKCSWDYADEEIEDTVPVFGIDPYSGQPVVVDEKIVKKLKVIKNQPHAQTCRIEDVFIDPTCEGDVNKMQFCIHRYESDMSTLKQAGKYKNLDRVRKSGTPEDYSGEDFDPTDDTEFRFTDEPRKKLLVHEYWGNFDINGNGIAVPIVCTWVNDTIIQLEENPYPDRKIPFLFLANNSIPFKLYGEANAELIGDNQKINTAIKRGIMDNMANSNNAQKGVRVGALDPLNMKRFLNGKNFEYNGSTADFYEGSYNQIPGSVFNTMEMVNNENESMLGVKAFSNTGISGAGMGSTARAASGVLDAVSVRRSDIVRNIAENLIKPLMRKWTSYNAEFLAEEEVVRLTNEEFVPVKRDDLAGNIDIAIQVSTAEDNSARAQQLTFLLQTLGQQMDVEMRNLLMSEIAKLNKMPDLAKKMAEFQPTPDPFAEKMKELEVKLKEVEIMERHSRAIENEADLRLKTANAVLAEAKAGDLSSSRDLKDLEFTERSSGQAFQQQQMEEENKFAGEMEKKTFDHASKMEQKAIDNLTKQ